MSLTEDVKAFITDHQPHGTLTGDAGDLTPNGYRLEIACPCGVTFDRWVFPDDATADLASLARLNVRTDAAPY
jgi:hypothetical protein